MAIDPRIPTLLSPVVDRPELKRLFREIRPRLLAFPALLLLSIDEPVARGAPFFVEGRDVAALLGEEGQAGKHLLKLIQGCGPPSNQPRDCSLNTFSQNVCSGVPSAVPRPPLTSTSPRSMRKSRILRRHRQSPFLNLSENARSNTSRSGPARSSEP
ncbi:hypothetical protein PG994_009276 [Apiospora phragmitis]|uniref:Uncharacterized protein n=1 Tax=Apiospora phragmitis TaxID=2905665 RepID=A0ABR1UIU0_9PEZI